MSKNPSAEVDRKPLGACNKKPIVIKASKYKKMVSVITAHEAEKKSKEDEQTYKNNLKKGSDELVSKWDNKLDVSQEEKRIAWQNKLNERAAKEHEDFKKIKEKHEQIRHEKKARAEELVQKLKQGPQKLKRAAMESEVNKARDVQRQIKQEFEESLKEQSAEKTLQMERQAMPWMEEEQKRIANNIQRTNQHKAELLNTINEKARIKAENLAQKLAEEKAANNLCDKEIKAQINREQEMLKRKREALRKNALEAMIMVEQRRAREQYQDKLQGQLISIYNEGKKKMEGIKKEHETQVQQEKLRRLALNAQKMSAFKQDKEDEEENRYRKDISTIKLQFSQQEQERIKRTRMQKYARIQEYFKEFNAKKEQEQRKLEEKRFELANSLKNAEIKNTLEEKQRQDKIKNAEEVRKALTEQIEERKLAEAEEKDYDKKASVVSYEKDDNFFFDYAKKLVADAKRKDRPLLPFMKAINSYKKENNIDVESRLPPHLESHLKIGLKICETENANPGTPRKYGLDELKALNVHSDCN